MDMRTNTHIHTLNICSSTSHTHLCLNPKGSRTFKDIWAPSPFNDPNFATSLLKTWILSNHEEKCMLGETCGSAGAKHHKPWRWFISRSMCPPDLTAGTFRTQRIRVTGRSGFVLPDSVCPPFWTFRSQLERERETAVITEREDPHSRWSVLNVL